MAHTPGPWWHFQDSAGSWGVATYRDHQAAPNPIPVGYDVGASICHSVGDHTEKRTSENREDNARLIAAAPDLLAALEAIVADCGEPFSDGYVENSLHIDEVTAARAAIARAKGE